jgi:hypothetical protein
MGEIPNKMSYAGITPKTFTYKSNRPYWKESYYKIKKTDYEDSKIIFEPKGAINADRHVHATLKLLTELIKILEAKVKPIPASNIEGNLEIYEELLKLDPKNRKYKGKVAYYSSKLEKKLRAVSDLELLKWHLSNENGYVTVEGQVKNISGRKLTRVLFLVTWHDKNGDMITANTSLIEYDPILPGQTSPFKVREPHNPAMEEARIEFKDKRGNKIPFYPK